MILGSQSAAEDAVQDASIMAFKSASTFDPKRGTIANWFYIILKRVCGEELRKRARGLQTFSIAREGDDGRPDSTMDFASEDEMPDSALSDEGEIKRLTILLSRFLPLDDQFLFVALFIQDVPRAAVAENLGISDEALRARIMRGRKQLQDAIRRGFGQETLDRLQMGFGSDVFAEKDVPPPALSGEDLMTKARRARAALALATGAVSTLK